MPWMLILVHHVDTCVRRHHGGIDTREERTEGTHCYARRASALVPQLRRTTPRPSWINRSDSKRRQSAMGRYAHPSCRSCTPGLMTTHLGGSGHGSGLTLKVELAVHMHGGDSVYHESSTVGNRPCMQDQSIRVCSSSVLGRRLLRTHVEATVYRAHASGRCRPERRRRTSEQTIPRSISRLVLSRH